MFGFTRSLHKEIDTRMRLESHLRAVIAAQERMIRLQRDLISSLERTAAAHERTIAAHEAREALNSD
jgi:hypothetical protein